MITGLNSPLPGSKIESFQDLLCDKSLFETKPNFNISVWKETSKINSFLNNVDSVSWNLAKNPYKSSHCFRIHSKEFLEPRFNLFLELLVLNRFYFDQLMALTKSGTKPGLLSYTDKILWSFLHPGHDRIPQSLRNIVVQEKRQPNKAEIDAGYQQEMTNCAEKSAYISESI
jgi:hypothetical protein